MQCPRCNRWSSTPPICAWCGAQAYPVGPQVPVNVPSVRRKVDGSAAPVLIGGFLVAFLAALLGSITGREEISTALFALGALIGAFGGRWLSKRMVEQSLSSNARRFMKQTKVRPIRDAQEGFVRVTGEARAIELTTSKRGVECLAFEQRTTMADGSVFLHTQGGVFELDDGSGTRAIVRATHVGVPEGALNGDELVIPPGARVEVAGMAHWIMATDERAAPGSFRTPARILEIVGTESDPVIVRLIGPGATASLEPGMPAQAHAPMGGVPHAPTLTGAAMPVDPARVRVSVDAPPHREHVSHATQALDEVEIQRAHNESLQQRGRR